MDRECHTYIVREMSALHSVMTWGGNYQSVPIIYLRVNTYCKVLGWHLQSNTYCNEPELYLLVSTQQQLREGCW